MAQRRPHGSSLQQNIADPGLSWRKQVLEEDHKSKAGEEAEEIRRQIEKKRIEEARERLRSNAEKYEAERELREESGNAAESRVRRVDPDQERPTESERPKNTRAENQEAAQKKSEQPNRRDRAAEQQRSAQPNRRDRAAQQKNAQPNRRERAAQQQRSAQPDHQKRAAQQKSAQSNGARITAEERRRRVEAQRRRMAAEKRRRLEEQRKTAEKESRQVKPVKTKAANPPAKDKKQEKKPGKKKVFTKTFTRGFFIAWGIFVALLIVLMIVLSSFLKRFENGLPEHYLDKIVEELGQGNMDSLHLETADGVSIDDPSLMTDKSQIASFVQSKSAGEQLRYVKVNAESEVNDIVYSIRSGDEKLLKIYLSRDPNEKRAEWTEQKTVLDSEDLKLSTVTAQIPSDCTLVINGKSIDKSFVTEPNSQIQLLSNLVSRGFISDMPTLDTYTVQGIFPSKEVTMTNASGNTVPCSLTGDVYHAGFEVDEAFATEETARVLSMFEPYALYFSGDATKDVLTTFMLDNSPAYQSASAADVSWMQAHDGIDLVNQSVENIRRYSDTCFSCDISFEQNIYQGGEVVRTWDTNMTWILVWDGDYYLADFITKTADEK